VLNGRVRRAAQRDEYERVVTAVPGVRYVVNNISVLPNSAYDDELRAASFRALYQEPRLRPYCRRPFYQIHVLVDYGDVTLEGRVLSRADKQLAEELLRSEVRPFDVVNNLKVETAVAV
jgi:osmotically-inducible protein OsmY